MRKEIVGVLEGLSDSGDLSPENVVQSAAKKDSPLHGCFEWDNTKAAHAHRIDQARTLIRSVKIDVKVENVTLQTCRYVRDPEKEPGEQGYTSVVKLKTEREIAVEALTAELQRTKSLLVRTLGVAASLDFEGEIGRIIEELDGLTVIVEGLAVGVPA